MRFRRLKCAGNVARRSSAVKPAATLGTAIGARWFSAVLSTLGHHELVASCASDGVADSGILSIAASAQIFEPVPYGPNDEGGYEEFG